MNDPIEQVFREVAEMSPAPPKDENPYESEEYAKFVESMIPHCHCSAWHRPCDGVLAGGVCDGLTNEPSREDLDRWDAED